jgi:predicted Zn finger-like uncharacterized protein
MFTVCPKCALTLVVTAADLRIAQGYVRCGRCSSVFNSLPHLTDERPPPLPPEAFLAPSPPAGPQITQEAGAEESLDEARGPHEQAPQRYSPGESVAAAEATDERAGNLPQDDVAPQEAAEEEMEAEEPPAETVAAQDADSGAGLATTVLPQEIDPDEDTASHITIPEEALEFNPARTDAAAVFVAAAPDPQWAAATGTFRALSAAKPEVGEAREVDSAYLASMLRAPAAAADTHAPAAPAGAPGEAAAASQEESLIAAEDPLGATAQAQPLFLSRVPRSVWRIGTPLALLLLIAQVVNHNRDELAATARFNGPLTALYGALGVHLVPGWDLRAYDVRQLGAEASPPGSGLITVHASIKNAAPQAQPLPLLRVTLQDRFGNRIAARDVTPRAYLPAAAATMATLSAGQRIDAAMGFVDPGANAVGFEIDACLPASAGGIACANDAGAR